MNRYIYLGANRSITDSIIAKTIQVKLANVNALDDENCFVATKIITQITVIIPAKKNPSVTLVMYLKNSYIPAVSFPVGIVYGAGIYRSLLVVLEITMNTSIVDITEIITENKIPVIAVGIPKSAPKL